MTPAMRDILTELRSRLQELYGERLTRMILYGSQAREEAGPDSDIDVLVVLAGEVSPCEEIARTERAVADVSLNHNCVIACVFVSEEQFRREQSPLFVNVRREGVTV